MRSRTSFKPRVEEVSDSEAQACAATKGYTPKDCEDAHHDGKPDSLQRALGCRWGIGQRWSERIGEQTE